MTYTAEKPPIARSSEELRATIPGWGVDLDPADRPSFPREQYDPGATGAHWDLPELQQPREGRERSIEHGMLPPVFGTAQPLHGVSGVIRRVAYDRFSEARAAHWLLLLAADRVDAAGGHVRSLAQGHPEPLIASGLKAELSGHGVASRVGRGRADVKHQWLDPLVVAGPWLVAGAVGLRIARRLRRA